MWLALPVTCAVASFGVLLLAPRTRFVPLAIPVAGVLFAAAIVAVLGRAARAGWPGLIVAGIAVLAALGLGLLGVTAIGPRLDEAARIRWFRAHRESLEALARGPAGEVREPALRARGVRAFERAADREYFAVDLSSDNGRTPDRLFGFVHARQGPPAVGDELPRPAGYYREGAPPLRLTRLTPLGGAWWSYAGEQVRGPGAHG